MVPAIGHGNAPIRIRGPKHAVRRGASRSSHHKQVRPAWSDRVLHGSDSSRSHAEPLRRCEMRFCGRVRSSDSRAAGSRKFPPLEELGVDLELLEIRVCHRVAASFPCVRDGQGCVLAKRNDVPVARFQNLGDLADHERRAVADTSAVPRAVHVPNCNNIGTGRRTVLVQFPGATAALAEDGFKRLVRQYFDDAFHKVQSESGASR